MFHIGVSLLRRAWTPSGRVLRPLGSVLGLVVVLSILLAGGDSASGRAAAPLDYLREAQNRDGGFGFEPGEESAPLSTGWAVFAAAAAGVSPYDLRRGGANPIGFLRDHAREITEVGEVERTILVLRTAGIDPRHFAGQDLIDRLLENRRANGSFAGFVSYTSFGILALRSSGYSRSSAPVRNAVDWLLERQNRDGGFDLAGEGAQSTGDDTGYALQALAQGGAPPAAKKRAVSFLRLAQNRDGGFPFIPGGPSNSQSTSYVVQGLVAAGVAPGGVMREEKSPLDYLLSRTDPGGSVDYSKDSEQTPVWVTAQAIFALEKENLPLAPIPREGPDPGSAGAPKSSSTGTLGPPRKSEGGRSAAGRETRQTGPVPKQVGSARETSRPRKRETGPDGAGSRETNARASSAHSAPLTTASDLERTTELAADDPERGFPVGAVLAMAVAIAIATIIGVTGHRRNQR